LPLRMTHSAVNCKKARCSEHPITRANTLPERDGHDAEVTIVDVGLPV
jgi:hypothetical protein